MLLIVGYATFLSPRFFNGLGRVMLPIADIEPYTATVIDEDSITPKSGKRYPAGAAINITVRVGGRSIPQTATLYRSSDGQQWRPVPMRPAKQKTRTENYRTFRFNIPEADASFQFYIAAGDDRSRDRSIEIVQRPQVESLSVTYEFPDYTGREPEEISAASGELNALVGTRIRMKLTSTKPLHSAALETETGSVITMSGQKGKRSWNTSFVLWSEQAQTNDQIRGEMLKAPTRYKIRLIDTDAYENTEPLWRAVTLINDQPPRISIPVPGRDEQVKAEDPFKLTIEARDDYGLQTVSLIYRVNDDKTLRQLVRFPHSGQPELKSVDRYEWDLQKSGIQPGDHVQYWAIASDRNALTGPGETISRRFSIFVITPEQILAKLEMRMDDYAAVLEELIRLQRENRAQTASGVDFDNLLLRQTRIRTNTAVLSRAMKSGALPVATMVKTLTELYAGLMADAIRLFETGRDTEDAGKAAGFRTAALPVQEEIIQQLEGLLKRLRRNEDARK
ncbi:MAG: DUF4175 family protein, partial [Planctomycetaceae bacterium]